jgi:hypothetical protein
MNKLKRVNWWRHGSVIDGLILFQKRIYIPPTSSLLHTILKAVHAMGHEGVQKMLHRFRKDFHTP